MKPEAAMRLMKSVRDFYESVAPEFDRSRQRSWPDFHVFVPYLRKGWKILDAGCGNGRLLGFLPKDFKSYEGIDSSPSLLSFARRRHRSKAIRFSEGSILALPSPSNRFDAVFCIATLHHIPSRELQRKALGEFLRVLSPQGLLFLTVWDLYKPRYFFSFVRRFFSKDLWISWGKSGARRYCHAFTLKELRGLLMECGFEILEADTLGTSRAGNHVVVARPFIKSRRSSRTRLLGVEVDAVTLDEAHEVVHRLLESGGSHMVVTPNPEILLRAASDASYQSLLNRASLSIPDGMGLLWASSFVTPYRSKAVRFFFGMIGFALMMVFPRSAHRVFPERVTGVDLIERLADRSRLMGSKLFLLGAAPGVAEEVARRWRLAEVVGTFAGSPLPRDENAIVERVNASGANLLFVAYGAPAQEEWMARNLKKMPHVRVAIGVGGAFDFISGIRSRAPRWMGRVGLEWLWRLAQEPRRIKRIWNAVVRFPWKVIFSS